MFGKSYNPEKDIPDLTDKVILVTGGNTGLGKASIVELIKHNPKHVYLAARTQSKAEAAIADIRATAPEAPVSFLPLDLMSFESIKKAADQFIGESDRLDILMNNAGIMAAPLAETREGYESQFGTNHMGHALFTKLLLPTLVKTAEQPNSDVRIVNLSSDGHNMAPRGGLVLDDAKLKSLGPWPRYGHSKLANILHAKGLAKRYPQITSVSVHPGFILTDLYSAHGNVFLKYLTAAAEPVMFTPVKEGAYNQLWASTTPKEKLQNGGYYKPVGSKAGGSYITGYARDEKLADKLWEWTEEELSKHGY